MTPKFGENWLMKCIVVFSFWGASPPRPPDQGLCPLRLTVLCSPVNLEVKRSSNDQVILSTYSVHSELGKRTIKINIKGINYGMTYQMILKV